MFGRKKANKLIEDIDRYFDLMDQSVLVFKSGVRNYLYSNKDDFNDNLMKMSSLDSEADVLRREIESALYTQTALVRSRADIMRLLEKTRSITHYASGLCCYSSSATANSRIPIITMPMNT